MSRDPFEVKLYIICIGTSPGKLTCQIYSLENKTLYNEVLFCADLCKLHIVIKLVGDISTLLYGEKNNEAYKTICAHPRQFRSVIFI